MTWRGDRESAWLVRPIECGPRAGFGVYLHVPFCAHRCGYCDFAVHESSEAALMARYVAALRAEILRSAEGIYWPEVTSVFVGGGTPTLLPTEDLAGLVALVRASFEVAPDAEITVECNPETVRPGMFPALAAAGVNRVSLGLQSSVPQVLHTLERRHSFLHVAGAMLVARDAGVAVNLDLIYGTPGEREEDWERTLDACLWFEPEHVSAYALTVHRNTPMGRAVASGALAAPDDDEQRSRWEVARAKLAEAGFDHYEVSNWARFPELRSRHNLLYWRHGDYLAFGVGAHGHFRGHRWWAHRGLHRYLADVESGRSPLAGEETLTVQERATERLLLGLRVREGLHPGDVPPLGPFVLDEPMASGLLTLVRGRMAATPDGWFLLDELVARLA